MMHTAEVELVDRPYNYFFLCSTCGSTGAVLVLVQAGSRRPDPSALTPPPCPYCP